MLLFFALDIAQPQPAPKLTVDEKATLSSREVVVRTSEDDAGNHYLLAVIDVDAPPDVTLNAVLDVEARAKEVSVLESVSLYRDTPTQIGADYAFDLPGYDGHFFILYDVDRAKGFAHYYTDTSQDNDVESASGSYQVFPRGQGSRLVYRVHIEEDGLTPLWVKKALVTRTLPEQIKGIRSRAEN